LKINLPEEEKSVKPKDFVNLDMAQNLVSFIADGVVKNQINILKTDIQTVVKKLAQYKNISETAAYFGIAELFRIGAANAGASHLLSVLVNCSNFKIPNCYISKHDTETAMEIILSHKAIRKLAETMARRIFTANLMTI